MKHGGFKKGQHLPMKMTGKKGGVSKYFSKVNPGKKSTSAMKKKYASQERSLKY